MQNRFVGVAERRVKERQCGLGKVGVVIKGWLEGFFGGGSVLSGPCECQRPGHRRVYSFVRCQCWGSEHNAPEHGTLAC